MQDPVSRAQREGLRTGDDNPRHGRAQVGRILAYKETFRVQVRMFCSLWPLINADVTSSRVQGTRKTSRPCALDPLILQFIILRNFNPASNLNFFFCYTPEPPFNGSDF